MKTKQISYVAIATLILLLIPLVAMQFTQEVNWTLSDFVVAGVLLFGAGMIYGLASMRARTGWGRLVIGAAVLICLALIWGELATGYFG